MGTWCNMSDGEDFGAVVRANTFICSTPFDSNTVSFTQLLTNTATAIYDDVFLGGCEASEENPLHNTTCFSTAQEILPLSVTNTKQEPDGAENIESVVFKPPPIAEKAVDCIPTTTKTHKNPHSLTKPCSSSKIPGIKKRKSQQRRIMRIPMAEGSWNKQGGAGVPSDLWSWRKYGQKPIKGSPYPRGYYRCSSSKGCPARKQLERSFTDPTMLVITYTEDHNHAWPANRRSSAQNSLDEKTGQPLSLFVPHTPAKAKDNQDAASPQNESQQEKQKPNSEVVDSSSFEEEDQYLGDNHMLDDNLFSDFGEPPELYNKDFLNHSDEEDGSTMVDPFNLFDWSFSTNEMPIHDVCF